MVLTSKTTTNAHMGYGVRSPTSAAQLAAVGGVSLLTLAIGMIASANWVNLPCPHPDRGRNPASRNDYGSTHPRRSHARYGCSGSRYFSGNTTWDTVKAFCAALKDHYNDPAPGLGKTCLHSLVDEIKLDGSMGANWSSAAATGA
jgi:hypothetical protein